MLLKIPWTHFVLLLLSKIKYFEEIGPEILSGNVLPITKFPFILVLKCLKLSSWLNNVDFSEWKREGVIIFLFIGITEEDFFEEDDLSEPSNIYKICLRQSKRVIWIFDSIQSNIHWLSWGRRGIQDAAGSRCEYPSWPRCGNYVQVQSIRAAKKELNSSALDVLDCFSHICSVFIYVWVCVHTSREWKEKSRGRWTTWTTPSGIIGFEASSGSRSARLSSRWIVHDGKHFTLHCLSARRLHGANSWIAVFLFAQCLHSFGTCFIGDCW